MRRRRIVVGLVLLALAGVAVVFWPRPPRPCLDTFDRVRVGMTREEVYATVGEPLRTDLRPPWAGGGLYDDDFGYWQADDGTPMWVCFRRDFVAKPPVVFEVAPRRSFWDRMCARLGL
jgi:hypothetical protein